MKPEARKRTWELGAGALLLLTLAAILGLYLYRQQLNRTLTRELEGVNIRRGYGPTLVVIRRLIRQGADVNTRSASGEAALHWLASSERPGWVADALDRGAKINQPTRDGSTPLMRAVTSDLATTRLLIQRGADVNARDDAGKTQLHWAAASGYRDPRVLRLLLDHGADPKAVDRFGETTVYIAAIIGSEACIETLLAAGADPNAHNPLAEGALHNSVPTIRALLRHGARIDARDGSGETALCEATHGSYEDAVHYLVAHGANPNIRDRYGDTLLVNLEHTDSGTPERNQARLRIIAYLKQHGAHR